MTEHAPLQLPLTGLRVVEYGRWITAPYCGKLLADMGAAVTKVEDPAGGDPARRQGPFPDDRPDAEKSGLFLYLNMGKRGISLDLHTAGGRKLLRRLLSEADVFIEDGKPGELAALGLDPAGLRREFPQLIVVSVTPFGQTGPYRDYKATDLVIWQLSGFGDSFPGMVDDPSAVPPLNGPGRGALIFAGVTAALATVSAVHRRRVAGVGSHVDVSQFEAVSAIMYGEVGRAQDGDDRGRRRAVGQRPLPPIAVVPCRDGYVAISPREQHQWERWLAVLDHPAWASEPRFATVVSREENWDALWALVTEWTASRTREEVYAAAQAGRVPCFPVNQIADVLRSAQFAARQFFVEIDHPVAGRLRYPSRPYRFSEAPLPATTAAPTLGQHNAEVLGALGLGDDLGRLRAGGVI